MGEIKDKTVYLHRDKQGVVRYVGSGGIERAYKTHANSQRGKGYAEFVESNGKLEVEIVAECLSKLEAENLERELYDKYQDTILNYNRPNSVKLMTKAMFQKYLSYDESSKSCLKWKIGHGRMKSGQDAGSLHVNGYYLVWLCGTYYRAHRIVALLHDFEVDGKVIDHIDRNKTNNKISNLRVVSQKENMQNVSQHKLSSRNTSGVQGVSYDRRRDCWVAGWCEKGAWKSKYFAIKDYSSSEEAFKTAYEYRKLMVECHYHSSTNG